MPFTFQEGCIKDLFVTEEELVNKFTGQELWLWGCGSFGRLGTNSAINQSSPVQTISGGTNWRQVSLGTCHSAAIKTDGTLWLWGYGCAGRLGTGNNNDVSSPVQTVSGGTNWKQVSLGDNHSAAIKTDGTLWLWGNGGSGRLGDDTFVTKSSPVQTISGGTNWKQVSLGGVHSAAIKTDGTLWLWGSNVCGRLGVGFDSTSKSSPVQTITGGTSWKQVSLGDNHSAAIKTDGTLWLWGFNLWGQLGTGNTICKFSPVETIAGGTNWKQVSLGVSFSAAIKTDGTLWLWGIDGDGNSSPRSSPVQTVSGGNNWRQVSLGDSHTAAIKTDGTLWLWGSGLLGALGDGTTISRSSPTQTISGGTNWRQVSLGGRFSAATRLIE